MENENFEETQTDDVETSNNNDGENQTNQTEDELKSALAQKKHWKDKFEKLEKELGDKKSSQKSENKKSDNSNVQTLAQKALLNSLGFKSEKEHEYVLGEAKRLQKDISEIIGDKYHISQLKDIKDQAKAESGIPNSKRGSSGDTDRDVDYYAKNKTLPDDLKLAEKVIDAQIQSEKGSKFSDEMFSGSADF